MDVTQLPMSGVRYDLVVDSFCLQGIVLDGDRKSVFQAVRARLKPSGDYSISTAMYNSTCHHPADRIVDSVSGKVYHRYDGACLFDPTSDVFYEPFSDSKYDHRLQESPGDYEGSSEIAGKWYLLTRRYRTAQGLRAELEAEGFNIVLQTDEFGENVLCKVATDS